jgi:hypothetical protein
MPILRQRGSRTACVGVLPDFIEGRRVVLGSDGFLAEYQRGSFDDLLLVWQDVFLQGLLYGIEVSRR